MQSTIIGYVKHKKVHFLASTHNHLNRGKNYCQPQEIICNHRQIVCYSQKPSQSTRNIYMKKFTYTLKGFAFAKIAVFYGITLHQQKNLNVAFGKLITVDTVCPQQTPSPKINFWSKLFSSHFNLLSRNPTKWSNTLKQLVGNSQRIV